MERYSVLANYTSECGCNKAQEFMNKYGMIDILTLEDNANIYRMKVGTSINGYNIYEEIEYCMFCGNRFDGRITQEGLRKDMESKNKK